MGHGGSGHPGLFHFVSSRPYIIGHVWACKLRPYIIWNLSISTGSFPIILTAQKTVETGGTIYRLCGYTCFCAEEPVSCGSASERTSNVEPDEAAIVQESGIVLMYLLSASEARR